MATRPRARVHLDNITANWQRLSTAAEGAQAGAVVKADAYGHGAAKVGAALARAGCQHFFVAYPFEGDALRRHVGAGAEIYVFNGVAADDDEAIALCRRAALLPVLNSLEQLRAWRSSTGEAPYALHIDTGMNRLGIPMGQLGEARLLASGHGPDLVMSHLACAEAADDPMNARQQGRFAEAAARFPGALTSLPNTAGHFLGPAYRSDVTRPGIGLYGGGTSPRQPALAPGMTLEAPILTVNEVPAGDTVGYGATYTLDRPALLATVAMGYGDGFLRSLTNCGIAALDGTFCPIVGRVSMDLATIDVTAAAGVAKPGALIEVIGSHVRLEDQAARAGTLGYELVTGLGARVERHYDR